MNILLPLIFENSPLKWTVFSVLYWFYSNKVILYFSYRTNVRYRKEAEITLYQLGREYLKQAEELKGVIESYSALKTETSGIELYELNSKITVLKEMERDTRITGNQLVEYYSGKSMKKRYCSHRINWQKGFYCYNYI